MKYIIRVLLVQAVLIFSLAFYPLLLHAQDTEAEQILQLALEKQDYQTMQADVVTEMGIKTSSKKMTQEYHYLVKKPDKIKMQMTKPYLQTIVLSEGIMTMKMMDGTISKKSILDLAGAANIETQKATNIKEMEDKYNISKSGEYTENGAAYMEIKLKSKNSDILPDNAMKIEKGTGKIVEVKMFDKTGNVMSDSVNKTVENIGGINVPVEINNTTGISVVNILYKNVKINEKISDDEFEAK